MEDDDSDDRPRETRGGTRRGAGRKKIIRNEEGEIISPVCRTADYAKAGDPPLDPLAAVEWFAKVLTIAAQQVIADGTISEKNRRNELRQIAKSVSTMVPLERLLEAERKVRRAADEMDRPNADSELKNVSENPSETLRM